MEKLFWCWSDLRNKHENGTDEVNRMLAQGWKVKMISTSAAGAGEYDDISGQAYIVLQKEDER